jgi:putative ABC transport system permease protein
MSEFRLAARLARREVRRRPGRTALVAVLVALPVGFMVLLLVLFRTWDVTQDEAWQREHSDADALLEAGGGFDPADLPRGARTATVTDTQIRVRTGDGAGTELLVYGFPAADPMLDGLIDLVAGRLPASGDEIALAPDVADELDVGVGDRLVLDRPAALELSVVGLVEKPANFSTPLGFTTPDGALLDADPRRPASSTTYVDLPGAAAREELRGRPGILTRGDFIEDAEGMSTVLVPATYVFGAVVLTVFGIVIAAAFAARARRQLVTLGQLSANGAPGRVLRLTLILQGTVTGLLGALAGLLLTLGFFAVGTASVEEMSQARLDHYDIRPAELAGAVVIGVAAATVAALIPAWSVGRISTLAALAGRRPLRPVRHRVTVAGAVAVAAGVGLLGLAALGSQTGEDEGVWALVAVIGGVLELLGACAVAPAVVSRLEPLAGRTRGTWRLAARSLARERARTGAVVSAVAAAAGLAVAVTALVTGISVGDAARPAVSERVVVATEVSAVTDATYDEDPASPRGGSELYAPPDAAAQDELAALLPGAEPVTLRTAGHQHDWADIRVPVVADPAVLDGLGLGDDVRRALARTGVLVIGSGGEAPDQVTLPGGQVQDVVTVSSERNLGYLSGVLVSPGLVDEIGVEPHDAAVAFVNDRPLTQGQLDDVEVFLEDWQFDQGPSTNRAVSARWSETGPTPVQLELIVAGVALVFAVLVVGATLALAAAESRDERDVLTVTGVAPRMLARAAAARAWLLAVIGAAMAVPIGLLPVAVLVAADDGAMQLVVPWRAIGLLAFALPAIAAAVALAASATAQRLRPVRVSTAVFE